MGLSEDKRQIVKLSRECWDCLDVIKDVGYATFTIFWSDKLKLVQQAIRRIAPDMKDYWNLSSVLQLQHLLTDMLPQVDHSICTKLSLPQIRKGAWWYTDT